MKANSKMLVAWSQSSGKGTERAKLSLWARSVLPRNLWDLRVLERRRREKQWLAGETIPGPWYFFCSRRMS